VLGNGRERKRALAAAIGVGLIAAGSAIYAEGSGDHSVKRSPTPISQKGVIPSLLPDGSSTPGRHGPASNHVAAQNGTPSVIVIPSAGGPVYARGGFVTSTCGFARQPPLCLP
jgi:hypothetical protein